MKWRRVGRPKQDLFEQGRIANDKRDGMKMLASAVLKQWLEDGKPDDLPKEWVAVLKFLMEGNE